MAENMQVELDLNSLVCIFSFLDVKDKQNVAQVCQFWNEVVYLPVLWHNVVAILHHNLDKSLLLSLEKRKITRFGDVVLNISISPVISVRSIQQSYLEKEKDFLDVNNERLTI